MRFAASGGPVPGAVVHNMNVPGPLQNDQRLPRRVIEVEGLPPEASVEVEMGGERCTALTMPAPGSELRLLVGSCYYMPDDGGRLARAYENLRQQARPHLRLHCGDQLYLDAGPLPDAPTPFEGTRRRYVQYWDDSTHGGYLRGGATLFTADDHDFWNDYPFLMPHLDRSWDGAWESHAQAAQRLLEAYQTLGNPDGRPYFVLDLGLVSLFVLDTRTRRGTGSRNGPKQLFDPVQKRDLLDWSQRLAKPGLLVSPMPLFQQADSKALVFTTDHNLLSFPEDARAIWQAVEGAAHDVAVLTGDIHQGRVVEWHTTSASGLRRHFEIVSSPLRLLGWPKQPKERKVPPTPTGLQLGAGAGRRDFARVFYATSKDHFVLLNLQDAGQAGVRVSVSTRETPSLEVPLSELDPRQRCATEFFLR